jgi:hypothetical protein
MRALILYLPNDDVKLRLIFEIFYLSLIFLSVANLSIDQR